MEQYACQPQPQPIPPQVDLANSPMWPLLEFLKLQKEGSEVAQQKEHVDEVKRYYQMCCGRYDDVVDDGKNTSWVLANLSPTFITILETKDNAHAADLLKKATMHEKVKLKANKDIVGVGSKFNLGCINTAFIKQVKNCAFQCDTFANAPYSFDQLLSAFNFMPVADTNASFVKMNATERAFHYGKAAWCVVHSRCSTGKSVIH